QLGGLGELLHDPRVALAAHLSVVQIRLARIDADDHDPVSEVHAPVTRSDHLFEVHVPHVLRVVVPGHRDDAALDLLEVRRGRLELAAESFVGDVSGADDDVGLELVQLDDHAVQQVRNEVNGTDVEVADVRDRDQRYSSMMTRTEPSLEIMENPVISPSRRKTSE